jgi:hypothetical protein
VIAGSGSWRVRRGGRWLAGASLAPGAVVLESWTLSRSVASNPDATPLKGWLGPRNCSWAHPSGPTSPRWWAAVGPWVASSVYTAAFFLARLPHRVFFLRSPQHTVTSSPGSAGKGDWSGGYDKICTGVQGLLSSLTVAEVFGRSVRVVRANEYQCRTLALFLRDVCDFACSIRYIYSVVLLKRCVYAWIARDSALPC